MGSVSGEVRFGREVALPEGAVVTVKLLDTTLADAPSVELGLDVIENADRLPVRFRIEYDRDRVMSGNEYSLSADVRLGDDLLYTNDTVHFVLTRGAPADSDVVVVSINPFDTCVEPLPGQIHSGMDDEDLPREAVLHVRLIDVTDPQAWLVVADTTQGDLDRFPIEFSLPHEGVQISRHHRYELEAEIVAGDEILYHIIPGEEWRRIWLPHCPNADLQIVTSVFPASEFPEWGTDPSSGPDRATAEATIHAAVVRQLVEFNNTFSPDHRFAEVLIVDHVEAQAGDGEPEGERGASLTDGQRSAIRAAIEHLAPVRFIDNRRAYIRQDVLQPTIPGSVIITLGPVEFDNEGATVGADLWCGGLCGLRLTLLAEEPDGWAVTEGLWSIS